MVTCAPGIRVHPETTDINQIDQQIWFDDMSISRKEKKKGCETCAKTLEASHGLAKGQWSCSEHFKEYVIRGCAHKQKCNIPPVDSRRIPANPPGVCRSACTEAKCDKLNGVTPGLISAWCSQYATKSACEQVNPKQKLPKQSSCVPTICKWYNPPGHNGGPSRDGPEPVFPPQTGKSALPCAKIPCVSCGAPNLTCSCES